MFDDISTRRRARWCAMLGATAILVSACGSGGGDSSGDTGGTRRNTIVFGMQTGTLDPILADQAQNDTPDNILYDSIVEYGNDNEIVPRLATSWTVSSDAKTVSLTLRSDAKFHDGTTVTARDVVYTLDRVKALGLGVASLVASYESSTAVDDTHVQITLKRADALFLGALSKIYVVNSALVKQHAGSDNAQTWLASHEAGSGAYTLQSYRQGAEIRTVVNPSYWNAAAGRPQRLIITNTTDSATTRDQLRSGTIDIASLGAEDTATFAESKDFTITEVPGTLQTYVFFNTQNPKLADVRVREAISYVYDYTGHVQQVLSGDGQVANGILPRSLSCRADLPQSTQDLSKAKELLAAAGVHDLTLTAQFQPYLAEHKQAATLLQSNLRDIGVTLNLQTITYPAYVKELGSPATTPDLVVLWDFAQYPDPGVMLYRTYHSKLIGSGSNYGAYSNPKVDPLLEQAIANPDPDSRCDLYKQAQEIIAGDHVSMNIANSRLSVTSRAGVTGVGISPTHQALNLMDLRVS